jgi:hypothetical protein
MFEVVAVANRLNAPAVESFFQQPRVSIAKTPKARGKESRVSAASKVRFTYYKYKTSRKKQAKARKA